MSEAILGTIIGGLIGLGGTIAVLLFEYKKWKKDLRVAHLRALREKYEGIFDTVYSELEEAFDKHQQSPRVKYPIDLLSDISIALPSAVRDAVKDNMLKTSDDDQSVRTALTRISINMKLYLAGIDSQINRELGIKLEEKTQ